MTEFKANNINIAYNILTALAKDPDIAEDINCLRDIIHLETGLSATEWGYVNLDTIRAHLKPRNSRGSKKPCRPTDASTKCYLVLYNITKNTKLFDDISYYINKYYPNDADSLKDEAMNYIMEDVCNLLRPDIEGLSYGNKNVFRELPKFENKT